MGVSKLTLRDEALLLRDRHGQSKLCLLGESSIGRAGLADQVLKHLTSRQLGEMMIGPTDRRLVAPKGAKLRKGADMASRSRNTRQQLKELLDSDPSLVAELRSALGMGEAPASSAPKEQEPISMVFEGTSSESPTRSQTAKSLKYQVEAPVADWTGDGEAPKALVIAYLPPEVATESILVIVEAEGLVTEGRVIAARSRQKAS